MSEFAAILDMPTRKRSPSKDVWAESRPLKSSARRGITNKDRRTREYLKPDEMARLVDSTIVGLEMLFAHYDSGLPFGLDGNDYIKMTHDLHRRRLKAVLEHATA